MLLPSEKPETPPPGSSVASLPKPTRPRGLTAQPSSTCALPGMREESKSRILGRIARHVIHLADPKCSHYVPDPHAPRNTNRHKKTTVHLKSSQSEKYFIIIEKFPFSEYEIHALVIEIQKRRLKSLIMSTHTGNLPVFFISPPLYRCSHSSFSSAVTTLLSICLCFSADESVC